MRIDPCQDCGELININSDHDAACPHRQRPVVYLCDALIRPARMYEDPEPAEYCENEVDYEDERCSEHEGADDDEG